MAVLWRNSKTPHLAQCGVLYAHRYRWRVPVLGTVREWRINDDIISPVTVQSDSDVLVSWNIKQKRTTGRLCVFVIPTIARENVIYFITLYNFVQYVRRDISQFCYASDNPGQTSSRMAISSLAMIFITAFALARFVTFVSI